MLPTMVKRAMQQGCPRLHAPELPLHTNTKTAEIILAWLPQSVIAGCCHEQQHHMARRVQPLPVAAARLLAAAACSSPLQPHLAGPTSTALWPTKPLLCCAAIRTLAAQIHCQSCTAWRQVTCYCTHPRQTRTATQGQSSTCSTQTITKQCTTS